MGSCGQEQQKRKKKPNVGKIEDENFNPEQSLDSHGNASNNEDVPEPVRIIIPNNNDEINKSMYDAIFKCESINKLYRNGWDYILYNRFVERIQRANEEKYFCSICLIGETNKGKTFLLNLLTGNELESGIEYKTEGISCKFTDFLSGTTDRDDDAQKEKKFLIFDSAGRAEPLLIEPEERAKLKDEELKNKVEEDNKDLKLSEEFLKNLLISHSKIILVIVNQLTLAEQNFLYELKNDNEDKYEELFIIHNLFNFVTRSEMENYINETVVHSIYFDISKDYFDNYDDDNNNELDKPYYFTEVQKNNKGNQSLIAHLFLGHINTKDPWIKRNNKMTIDFLKTKMQICIAKEYFSIEKTLERELQSHILMDKTTKLIKKENNDNIGFYGKLSLVKEKDKNDNKMKNFSEYREFSILGFTPNYIYYKDDKKMKFTIEVECPGDEDKDMKIMSYTNKGKAYFIIRGKKIYPGIIKKYLHKEDKQFSIFFSINLDNEGFKIVKDENPKYDKFENGIYKKDFKMVKKSQNCEYHRKEKDSSCLIF